MVYFERSDRKLDLPAAPSKPAVPAGNTQADSAQRTGVKFVCESADVSGFNMPASMLGG